MVCHFAAAELAAVPAFDVAIDFRFASGVFVVAGIVCSALCRWSLGRLVSIRGSMRLWSWQGRGFLWCGGQFQCGYGGVGEFG